MRTHRWPYEPCYSLSSSLLFLLNETSIFRNSKILEAVEVVNFSHVHFHSYISFKSIPPHFHLFCFHHFRLKKFRFRFQLPLPRPCLWPLWLSTCEQIRTFNVSLLKDAAITRLCYPLADFINFPFIATTVRVFFVSSLKSGIERSLFVCRKGPQPRRGVAELSFFIPSFLLSFFFSFCILFSFLFSSQLLGKVRMENGVERRRRSNVRNEETDPRFSIYLDILRRKFIVVILDFPYI